MGPPYRAKIDRSRLIDVVPRDSPAQDSNAPSHMGNAPPTAARLSPVSQFPNHAVSRFPNSPVSQLPCRQEEIRGIIESARGSLRFACRVCSCCPDNQSMGCERVCRVVPGLDPGALRTRRAAHPSIRRVQTRLLTVLAGPLQPFSRWSSKRRPSPPNEFGGCAYKTG